MISVKNIVFGVAIFLLTLFVGIYGINTFYGSSPDYEDFCPVYINNETSCIDNGGVWEKNTVMVDAKPVPSSGGYCNYDYSKCQKEFEAAEEKYWKGAFIIALPLGVIIIVIGAIIFGLEFVGAGLMAGGLGILIYGAGAYWRFAQDWLKFTLSAIGLVVIIYFAYWLNKRKK